MTTETFSPTAARVMRIVSGTFTKDSLGDAYDRTLAELRADPAGHLQAFSQLFVQRPPSAAVLAELQLPLLLQLTAPLLPEETRRVATALSARMADSARARETAFLEGADENTAIEINRGRHLLDQRRFDLARLLD